MIVVGGCSSLTSEDKELGLFISALLQLSHWEVAIRILKLSFNGNQICIAKAMRMVELLSWVFFASLLFGSVQRVLIASVQKNGINRNIVAPKPHLFYSSFLGICVLPKLHDCGHKHSSVCFSSLTTCQFALNDNLRDMSGIKHHNASGSTQF